MENICLPLTRLDVIVETLNISQRVAEECGERYIVVHYDLAVAKPALQLQATESAKFDNIFIAFGPFHITMAFFATLGHMIDGSGGPEILTECDALATGSLNGFVSGKHYNRCRTLHTMLAAAFSILHFRKFLSEIQEMPNHLVAQIMTINDDMSPERLTDLESTTEYQEFMTSYIEYTGKTAAGEHGTTAQYWIGYVHAVNVYLRFDRACRTNDLDLFIFALGEMRPYFFAAGRQNYARWMVKYHLNLLNVDETHPGVKKMLKSGGLSIRRTNKNFSRTPVDLTLEQIVNADAASRMTGIAAFGLDIGARKRWIITRSARTQSISNLMTMTGLKGNDDSTKCLQPYRLKRDSKDLNNIVSAIKDRMNPFEQNDDKLYCLTTGKVLNEDIKSDLVNYEKQGKEMCDTFVDDCLKDPARFEKPWPRKKLKNFSSAAVSSQLTTSGVVTQLKGTRDLFGRLLYLSTCNSIDLKKVFTFPLTPVPLSLSHMDGSMNKTDKSALMHRLETKVQNENNPDIIDVILVDAVFFLHTLVHPPNTYREIAKCMMAKLCEMGNEVHFVCDTYITPSLKESERQRRGAEETVFAITGPEQKRPRDWQKALRSPQFKVFQL